MNFRLAGNPKICEKDSLQSVRFPLVCVSNILCVNINSLIENAPLRGPESCFQEWLKGAFR